MTLRVYINNNGAIDIMCNIVCSHNISSIIESHELNNTAFSGQHKINIFLVHNSTSEISS